MVVVGDRHRLGVEVQRPGAERADHEVRPLERLVHRRRRVGPLHDRLEVGDVERERVQAAVPAHYVERVPGVGEPGQPGPGPHRDRHVLALGEQWAVGAAQVTLAVGGVFEELPVLGQVAAGRPDVPGGLHVSAVAPSLPGSQR